ncbi:nucleotide-binding protein [Desulfobacter curvatus]|uniref:nucleotide-binding protein n=1 Tax=Desulfobacter curvatus TaxID=2290 RepID=UPI0003693362|nr:nucleotide-binding protein [Desulfobacter curvatus]
MKRVRVFIGSASESLKVAQAFRTNLENRRSGKSCIDVALWNEGFFRPGNFTLEQLLVEMNKYDAALFVFAATDHSESRGENFRSVRDNVIFEAGIAMGIFGRERTFICVPQSESDFKLPSDFEGLNYVNYRHAFDEYDLVSAVGSACDCIEKELFTVNKRRERPILKSLERGDESDIALYTFCGVFPETVGELDKQYSVPSLFRLWVDPRCKENNLNVSLLKTEEGNVFSVAYCHKKGFPPNISLRPGGLSAIEIQKNTVGVQIPIRVIRTLKNSPDLAFSIRLIDSRSTQWVRKRNDIYTLDCVKKIGTWENIDILFNEDCWQVFNSDGNYRYAADSPDFKILPGIVLEFGGDDSDRPSYGEGEFEIGQIKLIEGNGAF